MDESCRIPVIALVTGERGHREIVRPLRALGHEVTVIDWEDLRKTHRYPRFELVRCLWQTLRETPRVPVFTDMSSVFLMAAVVLARHHDSKLLMRLRGDLFAESRDQIRFHFMQRQWPALLRSLVTYGLDGIFFRCVDRAVPVSQWIVRRLGITERSSIARIPCDPAKFACRAHTGASLRILAVTNFNYPQKVAAMGRFLEAAGPMLGKERITVAIAGAGIALETFKQRYSRYAEFLGHVSPIEPVYSQYDCFVHFSDLDAFPYVVLEAQASGLPVLVNNDCGMLEQVENGMNGYIVDLEDNTAVMQRLFALRDSPRLRTEIGTRARQTVAETYSLQAIGRSLEGALQRCVPARNA